MSPKKQHLWPTTTTTTRHTYTPPHHHHQNNNCTLTTLIKQISTLHNSFHTPQHFPKFLLGFMTISGIAGYCCMEYWYVRSVRERMEIYSNAYYQNLNEDGHGHGDKQDGGEDKVRRFKTARDGHYEGRKALFDTTKVRHTPYQEAVLKQQQQQRQEGASGGQKEEEEGRLATLAKRMTNAAATTNQSISLQRQVTRFW